VTEIWGWLGRNAGPIIALAAAGFTWWQASIARNHNRLSVRPKLTLYAMTDNVGAGEGLLQIELQNAGLGPAIVVGYRAWLDGNEMEASVPAVSSALRQFFRHHLYRVENVFSLKGYHAIRPGDKITLLRTIFSQRDGFTANDALDQARDRMTAEVEYESLYEEKFFCTWPSEKGRSEPPPFFRRALIRYGDIFDQVVRNSPIAEWWLRLGESTFIIAKLIRQSKGGIS
jgi:hypothetical protein